MKLSDQGKLQALKLLRCTRSFLLLLLPALVSATSSRALHIRVLVAEQSQLSVRSISATNPQDAAGLAAPNTMPTPLEIAASTTWSVGIKGPNLTLNNHDTSSPTLYLPPAPGSIVEIGGKSYRGGVLLRANFGRVQGINVVDIEDYLRGVVPAEMPPGWPIAALSAQAVIARTYAAARVNPALTYDTCATERCQVYGGIAAEHPGSDAAVSTTAGQVVIYSGKPASTFFSSDSGGFTASSAEVWGRDLPYLTAKADPHSADSPRAHWRISVSAAKVLQAATNHRIRIGSIKNVQITRKSSSGRVQEITLTGSTGTARLTGARANSFVRSIGAISSRVTLSGPVGPNTPLVVEGSGAGHGVGLSQYGALGLARRGQTHLHILGFYYPGTTLGELAQTSSGVPLFAKLRTLPNFSAQSKWNIG